MTTVAGTATSLRAQIPNKKRGEKKENRLLSNLQQFKAFSFVLSAYVRVIFLTACYYVCLRQPRPFCFFFFILERNKKKKTNGPSVEK
jgi:hypothetical protein